MALIYILSIIVAAFVLILTFWVTQKAYSKKWEDEEDER
jgi:hypothetical protein